MNNTKAGQTQQHAQTRSQAPEIAPTVTDGNCCRKITNMATRMTTNSDKNFNLTESKLVSIHLLGGLYSG